MPTISMFYGIIIRMYLSSSEHNPPHFHAYYGEYEIVINIDDDEIIKGDMPKRQLKYIMAWADIHKDELLAN